MDFRKLSNTEKKQFRQWAHIILDEIEKIKAWMKNLDDDAAMQRQGYEQMSDEDLDEEVIDQKEDEASNLNNSGREAQIAYLMGDVWGG